MGRGRRLSGSDGERARVSSIDVEGKGIIGCVAELCNVLKGVIIICGQHVHRKPNLSQTSRILVRILSYTMCIQRPVPLLLGHSPLQNMFHF